MKIRNILLTAIMALAVVGTCSANLISSPDYSTLDGVWEGFAGESQNPSVFVTASAGVATVSPPDAVEWNFYQGFGAGPAGNPALVIGQAYSFTIDSANVAAPGASAFVKAFDGGWGFLGDEFQSVALVSGTTTTINFTPVAGAIYLQRGTLNIPSEESAAEGLAAEQL